MNSLKSEQQLAVLQLVYQVIVSSDGGISESNDGEINLALETLGYKPGMMMNIAGNAVWEQAITFNPYEAFSIVSKFDLQTKSKFKSLLTTIAVSGGNIVNRRDVAGQIFARIGN